MENNRIGRAMARLHTIMQTLRGPGGCPWDALQTTASLKPYLLEEVYELLEALDNEDPDLVRDELGDLLLQVVFHAQIFAEHGSFDLADVADAISDKLERRHPHVFAGLVETEISALNRQWDRIKAAEKGERSQPGSPLEGIPKTLPALARAAKYLERSSRGKPVEDDDPNAETALLDRHLRLARLPGKTTDRAAQEVAYGDFLLAAVSWGRSLNLDAEQALRQALLRVAGRNAGTHLSEGD